MSNLRQAAQQALDALVEINKLSIGEHAVCLPGEIDTAMDALRAALAEPEQERPHLDYPCRSDGRCQYAIDSGAEGLGHCPPGKCCMAARLEPTAQEAQNAAENLALMKRMFPQPQTTHWEGCEAVHPECRAKPITAAEMSAWVKDTWEKCQAEAWQEPVAYCTLEQLAALKLTVPSSDKIALYTAPTPRKPLTDEEIVRLMVGEDRVQLLYSKPGDPYFSEFAEGAIRELVESGRAIERAHGIGEQT